MKKISERLKNKYLKEATNNLGEVEIKEDKIICYVNHKGLNNYMNGDIYKINIEKNTGFYKLKEMNINLPIYYIFDDIEFSKRISLKSDQDDIHIIFKNCVFNKSINIYYAPNLIFESNKYEFNLFSLETILINAGYLKITNEIVTSNIYAALIEAENGIEIINSIWMEAFAHRRFNLSSKKSFIMQNSEIVFTDLNLEVEGNLNIINSNLIGRKTKTKGDNVVLNNSKIDLFYEFDINAEKNIDIIDTYINNSYTYINCEKINLNNSKILSQYLTQINETRSSNNNDILKSIECKKIIYNGVNFSEINYIKQNNLDKQTLRNILIEQLKLLKNKIQNNIDNENIKKFLK